jgi:hypothetical protein
VAHPAISAGGRAAAAAALAAPMIVEFAGMPLDITAQSPDLPAIDRWLATRPAPFSVAEVPVADSRLLAIREYRQTEFMLHAMAHWQKTVHGYSGLHPELSDRLFQELAKFPDASNVQPLIDLGITYLVVHPDLFSPADWPQIEAAIGASLS